MNKVSVTKGFTLIELLVVISIIGFLATAVLVGLSYARGRAKITSANADLTQILKIIAAAQVTSSKSLIQITGSGCSDCSCRDGTSKINLPTTDACYIAWVNAITNISNASGGIGGTLAFQNLRDPWGSPYGLDENEGESGPSDCRYDTLRSYGPDGIPYNSDDISVNVPWSKPCQ
jgi:prepilin-type N-terminal cleavage/methylation domain-containing protein